MRLWIGIGSIGALGGLSYYFSKVALASKQEQGYYIDPREAAAREERALSQQETQEFFRVWGIHPYHYTQIETWDFGVDRKRGWDWSGQGAPITRAEAAFRLEGKTPSWLLDHPNRDRLVEGMGLHERGISWTYVQDYDDPTALTEKTSSIGHAGSRFSDFLGSIGYLPNESLLPRGSDSRRVRDRIGRSRWDSLREVDQYEGIYRDFHVILNYGFFNSREGATRGRDVLLGMGGFYGFVALWRPPPQSNVIFRP